MIMNNHDKKCLIITLKHFIYTLYLEKKHCSRVFTKHKIKYVQVKLPVIPQSHGTP